MYKKIASNTFSQILSKIITAGISIVLIGILTKYLPIEQYGNYNKIYSYLGIFAFLADLWLYTIAIREISKWDVSTHKIIWNILTLRLGLWLIIFILALWVAFLLPGYHEPSTLIAIAIVWVFTVVSLLNSSLLALMQSQMKMEFSLFSVVAGKLVNIGTIAFFLIYLFTDTIQSNLAFLSVFVAGLLWIILNTIMNYFYAKTICKIQFLFDRDYITHIFKISLPYWVALFLSVVYFKIDVIILSIMESPEQANISIALYGLPMKITEVLMVLWGFYLNSLLPSLSEMYKNNKITEIAKTFALSLKVLLSFWVLIVCLGNLFAAETIRIIATPEYLNPIGSLYNSAQVFWIVLFILMFYFVSNCFIYMLIASERQWILLWINFWVTIFNIIWNIIMIPYFSFFWAAIVTLLSQIMLMITSWYLVLKEIKIPRVYLLSYVFTLFLWASLYILFHSILWQSSLWDISKILVFVPFFLIFYIGCEYIFSQKIHKL